jgi:hypothetical protein
MAEYVMRGIPVIIKGDASALAALKLGWNPRRLARECGDMAWRLPNFAFYEYTCLHLARARTSSTRSVYPRVLS